MERRRKASLFVKYFLDKIIAALGLVITAPIFLVVGTLLKLQGEDVFFLQTRVGYLGREFKIFKFTTMPKGSEESGLITTINDPRPTKLGRFLRKTKMNEIPQLINVLIGDMSLVGPRPLIKSQLLESINEEKIEDYYKMRPGITGAASVYFHHEDRLLSRVQNPEAYHSEVITPQKIRLEREYREKWNLFLDCKLLLITMKTLLSEAIMRRS